MADVSSVPVHDYAGSIHFHSSHSYDARTPVPEILKSAASAGLHFVVLTDHFRLDARQDPGEAYHDNVLLLVGEEISPRYNHYLALGIQKPIVVWKSEANAQWIIDQVNAQGGFGFISHPDHGGAPLFGGRAYPWIQWNVKGYAGIGLWDLMSDWNSAIDTPWRTLWALWRPAHALKGPLPKTLERWDELTQKQHCVAIGEIDNHAHHRSFFGWKKTIFPFEFAFRTIRTHVLLTRPLTKDAALDQRMVLDALRRGQSYVSLDYWNNASGFTYRIYHDAAEAHPGGEIFRKNETVLEARLPSSGKLRLVRNGRVIREEGRRSSLQWDVDLPGVYRIEADQEVGGRWRPWIFSNPIWVK